MAAENCADGLSIATNTEYSGNVYQTDDGNYSFTLPTPGDIDSSPFDPTAIPDGTTFSGSYHTHGAYDPKYDNERFSPNGCNGGEPCDVGLAVQSGEPMFLGTPDGRIEVFYPNLINNMPRGCVLVGPPVPAGGPNEPYVPQC